MKTTVICGASGLVGALLATKLHERGDHIIVVGRNPEKLKLEFPFAIEHWSWEQFIECDGSRIKAIVNLSGAGVMERRWTDTYKALMTKSRVISTEKCAAICAKHPEIHLINASSVHAYGTHALDHKPFLEGDIPTEGKDCYLHQLITDWEHATRLAVQSGSIVTHLRIGVVLSSEGGALVDTAKPFSWFVGGRHGTGRQIMSWITLRDLVSGIVFLLDNTQVHGPVNMVSPTPCTNLEFAQAIGSGLRRPSLVPMPGFMIKAAMGQGGVELILLGQRVLPGKLMDAGFRFEDTEIRSALKNIFAR